MRYYMIEADSEVYGKSRLHFWILLRPTDLQTASYQRIRTVGIGVPEGLPLVGGDNGDLPCLRYKDGLHTIRIF